MRGWYTEPTLILVAAPPIVLLGSSPPLFLSLGKCVKITVSGAFKVLALPLYCGGKGGYMIIINQPQVPLRLPCYNLPRGTLPYSNRFLKNRILDQKFSFFFS